MEKLRILIGDNEEEFLTYLSSMLNLLGYDVIGTDTSGTGLIRKIKNLSPQVVIADCSLRGMSGFEISDIVERGGICPCIITFKNSPYEYELKLQQKIIYAYVQKPVNPGTIGYIIESAYFNFKRITQLDRKLCERKVLEKAKGMLMKRYGFSEEKAYEYIKKKSMDKGVPAFKIAKTIIEIIQNKEEET